MITRLPELLDGLPAAPRQRVSSLFAVLRVDGAIVAPSQMRPEIKAVFERDDAADQQTIMKILNRWTLEGALFNDLRLKRPKAHAATPRSPVALSSDDCAFCQWETRTPADTFGRVRVGGSVTASNLAKYDGLHSVVILPTHDPLGWSQQQVVDALTAALEWIRRAHQTNVRAIYPFIMWNSLPRAGATRSHSHMQVTLTEGFPYGRLEVWRRANESYQRLLGRAYFDDLYEAHDSLKLAGDAEEARWLAHLTPVKELETILLADAPNDGFLRDIAWVARKITMMGHGAFNLGVYLPPVGGETHDRWAGFPIVARVVDRGDPRSDGSDIGAMELFAQPVVASDPFQLASDLRA